MICKAEGQTHLGAVSRLCENVGVQLLGSEKRGCGRCCLLCCIGMLRLLADIELQSNEQIRFQILDPLFSDI